MSGFSRGFMDGFSRRIEKFPGAILLSVFDEGQEEMEKTVKDIVREWFAPAPAKQSFGSMLSTFQFKTQINLRISGKVSIEYSAWSNPDLFKIGRNAIGWAERHGYSQDQMKAFIYDLLMVKGIIGLPEYASVWQANHGFPYTNSALGWEEGHNMRFYQGEPLKSYLSSNALWESWEAKMIKAVEQAASRIDL